jgi:O-antigen/teichoic acid export membrane protein
MRIWKTEHLKRKSVPFTGANYANMFHFFKRKIHNLISDQKFSEILTGSVWALSARMISTGFGLVASIIIARLYGAKVVGIVAVVNSFLMLATIFTVLGTQTSLLRLIPEHLVKYSPTSAFRVYRKSQFMVILVSLVTGALFFICADLIAARVFSKPHLSFYFALASVFVVFKSLMLLNTQAVRGLRLIKVFALMQVFPQGFNLLLLIFLGFLWPSQNVPVYALLGGFAVTGILGWFIMEYTFRQKMYPEDSVHTMSVREILSISLPMLMTATMTFLIGQTGVIMLSIFRTEAEVGYYAIAVKLATLTVFILNAVNSMAGPKFSELFHFNKIDELFYVAKKSAKLIFWTTSPILLGFVVFGKLVLNIAFGKEFGVAYPALVLLVLGQFVNSISGATGLFMNMTGNQTVFRNIMLVAAVLNIGINLVLIPGYGIYGVAIAAMVSLIIWNVTTLLYIKMKFGKTTGYFPLLEVL